MFYKYQIICQIFLYPIIVVYKCMSYDSNFLAHPNQHRYVLLQFDSIQRCSTYDPCHDPNQQCLEGMCKCRPNYRYNAKLMKCEDYYCNSDEVCQEWDTNRVCLLTTGVCQCSDGTEEVGVRNGEFMCRPKTTHLKSCKTDDNCGTHEVCMDFMCKCDANYEFNHKMGRCESYRCNNDKDCQRYDVNRLCNHYGECVCKDTYKIDFGNGHKCTRVMSNYGHYCHYLCEEPELECVDNLCLCGPNYVLNLTTHTCVSTQCKHNSDCHIYDLMRSCDVDTGMCVCDHNYYETRYNGLKCVSKVPLTIIFVISGAILLCTSCYLLGFAIYRRYRKNRCISGRQVRETPLLIAENPVALLTQQHLAYMFDPPPPYSECVNQR